MKKPALLTGQPAKRLRWLCFMGCSLIGAISAIRVAWAVGGIVSDGTMGPAQTLTGSSLTIPQSLGTTTGTNLFHSFSEFNIGQGQTVTFTGSEALRNVISRVTGPDASTLEGALKSEIPHADFYLINPHGVTFGPGAQIDVPAAFHVSTAEQIRFADDRVYSASNTTASTLSAAAPGAFGFLGTSSANNGLIEVNAAQLAVRDKQTLDVAANKITIENNAALTAPADEIRLVAMQSTGEISLARTSEGNLSAPTQTPAATSTGSIDVQNSVIDTSGDGGGRIAVFGGETYVKDSNIKADNTGESPASAIKGLDIQTYSLRADNSSITFSAQHAGHAGASNIQSVGAMEIADGSNIATLAYGAGDAGSMAITAGTLSIDGEGSGHLTSISGDTIDTMTSITSGHAGTLTITSAGAMKIINGGLVTSSSRGKGGAGTVKIEAGALLIAGNGHNVTGIAVGAGRLSSGDPGLIEIVSSGPLDILSGGFISSGTLSANHANAGNISVKTSTLNIDGTGYAGYSGIDSTTHAGSDGNAGSVAVTSAGAIQILNGGVISSSTFGSGDAGNVAVNTGGLEIDGQGNTLYGAGIFSNSRASEDGATAARAGSVIVESTDAIAVFDGGSISTNTENLGGAGSVHVKTPILTVDNADISSKSLFGSGGLTGDVAISAVKAIHLANGGQISIQNGATVDDPSQVKAGTLTVSAPDIAMQNGLITANSSGNVAAGNIAVNFSHSLSMSQSFISTAANTGNGGLIAVNGGELILLQDSGVLTSVSAANGNGGNINVASNVLVMNTGVIQANAIGGAGGDITLNLNALIPSENRLIEGGEQAVAWQPGESGLNLIQAASATGISGTVNVTAPQLNLSGVLANLGGAQFSEALLDQGYCDIGTGSSLRHSGKGGLPFDSSHLQVF